MRAFARHTMGVEQRWAKARQPLIGRMLPLKRSIRRTVAYLDQPARHVQNHSDMLAHPVIGHVYSDRPGRRMLLICCGIRRLGHRNPPNVHSGERL
jgi:hypothetical protein